MRRGTMIGLAFWMCLWAPSAHAASVRGFGPPPVVGQPVACCQIGTTYGTPPPGAPPVSCFNVPPGPGLNACASTGGTLVSGSCHSDGACGGSTVCCQNIPCDLIGGPFFCAVSTEDACDATPAGVQTTTSITGEGFPGGAIVCSQSGTCGTPLPP
jgi:hypothetical protein